MRPTTPAESDRRYEMRTLANAHRFVHPGAHPVASAAALESAVPVRTHADRVLGRRLRESDSVGRSKGTIITAIGSGPYASGYCTP
jgi:hypothetical protein